LQKLKLLAWIKKPDVNKAPESAMVLIPCRIAGFEVVSNTSSVFLFKMPGGDRG